ncbi:MAG: transcriptional regulator [Rhodobacteraceae bacterium]|nr:transcriptional regulator [Paracoccaceae bacterium]
MQTHRAKRVEITIEQVMQSRLTTAIENAGVTGYTILPVFGGSGRSGKWARAGQISRAEGMLQVVCIVRPEKLDPLLKAAFAVVEKHIGVVCVTDCEVLRAERF